MLFGVPLVSANPASAAGARVVQEGESIQDAIDRASPGTEIRIRGHHDENVWINKSGISLKGLAGASISVPENPTPNPCAPAEFAPVVCVIPAAAADSFPKPFQYLRDVSVSNLTLSSPNGDAVASIFTNRIQIRNNVMPSPGCNGAFVLFATGFRVSGNEVTGSQFCDGIQVAASSNGAISGNTSNGSLFAGISVPDSSHFSVWGNSTSDNCIGIVVFDAEDPEGRPASDVSITRNVANANNHVCFPFGPDIPVGVTGILAAGVDGVVIKNNTANNNVTSEFTITAGGISVLDSPASDGSTLSTTEDALISRNTIFGNSSAAGPLDLNIGSIGPLKAVKKNHCDVAFPDASWCTG